MPYRKRRKSVEDIWLYVDKTTSLNGCWVWTGTPSNCGHGQLTVGGIHYSAHVYFYTLLKGPIPEGLTLDHLCRNPPCVNPEHLEPVTQKVNTLRGFSPLAINARRTECVNGHVFTPENTRMRKGGGRACRTCERKLSLQYQRRKRIESVQNVRCA